MSILGFLKGSIGEAMGALAHRLRLDKDTYTSINNVTLHTRGGTTQIDHIIVSKYGIFVIEAKNINGWIFGDEKSDKWTIVKPGRKHAMQNPLRQNFRHTRAIAELLNIEDAKIHSLVMFWGECEFKTPMPPNVLCEGYTSYIKSFDTLLFSDKEVRSIVAQLTDGMLPKTWATRQTHLASLAARYGSNSICPKCTKPLILRTAMSGARAGTRFYGCSGYPRCKFTAPHESDA